MVSCEVDKTKNGFEKCKNFETCHECFSSATLKSIKHQNIDRQNFTLGIYAVSFESKKANQKREHMTVEVAQSVPLIQNKIA